MSIEFTGCVSSIATPSDVKVYHYRHQSEEKEISRSSLNTFAIFLEIMSFA
jgi:hypothetical protein